MDTEKIGNFTRDEFGIWHHKTRPFGGTCTVAREDACKNRQEHMQVCLFWYNGTFAPMKIGDTPDTLEERWLEWSRKHQADKTGLLEDLEQLTLN